MALPTILLVDDTKLFLTMEKEMLSRSTALILTATNGREALDIARKQRPDLIFMDLSMPEMDGAACCAAIRSDPDLNGTRIVIVTTSHCSEDRERCSAAGCDGFLIKPFTRQAFLKLGSDFVPGIERREKRLSWHAPVFITINGETRTAMSVDVSSNGAFISSGPGGAVNDTVDLTFAIDESRAEWIEAWGRITWANPKVSPRKPDYPEGFGVQFLAIPDTDRERLTQFLRSRDQ